jgi:hypothetical protein
MKLLWNSLLISLGILLPTSTSIVLAESTKIVESPALTASTSELVVPVSDSAVPVAEGTSSTPELQQFSIQCNTVKGAQPCPPTSSPYFIDLTNATDVKAMQHVLNETPYAQKTLVSTEAIAEEKAFPAKRPETVVIPVVTQTHPAEAVAGATGESIKPVISPDTAPVSMLSIPTVEVTEAAAQTQVVENTPTTTAPSPQDSATGTQAPAQIETPEKPPINTAPSPKDSAAEAQTPAQQEAPEKAPTSQDSKDSAETKEPELSPEAIARQQKLIKADQLYMSGQIAAAERLYREVKDPFKLEAQAKEKAAVVYDPAKLPPAGAVYWRQSQEGLEQKLQTKMLVPLQFLVEQYPEFIPGQLRYAQVLKENGQPEEALQVLERATTLYPGEPDLLKAKIAALGDREKWLEASLAARQFALLYPDNPQSKEFVTLADENLERYKRHTRRKLRGNAIANAITGAVGFVLTGNLFGPISTIQSTVLLLRGESSVGKSVANQVKRRLPLMEDEQVLNYVREVGNKLVTVAGRTDFEYEFNVLMEDDLNAFALPGGKVFVNAGAILKTNSEAELAGLLAHELSHAVLSHGFQLATQGNLTANVTQFVPYGGILGDLLILNYSRDMERQADVMGTRILASSGYPADGMRNLMVTLDKQERDRPLFSWLSDHPGTKERISNLETLIERNGYNRYTYEGVARHLEIQKRVRELLREYKERKERKNKD